ncbi:MAG: hypothetical protein WCO69_02620 [Candidatus Omnitrophota bacterium]
MKKLNDNALFLSCWYERSRPIYVMCLGGLIAFVMLLSYLSAMQYPPKELTPFQVMLNICEVTQIFVLLIFGPLFVAAMGSREKMSGTLDFHRNSPEGVYDKIAGLVFGGAWLEWVIFGILLGAELLLSLGTFKGPERVIMFNVSIAISALLFQTTAALFSLLTTKQDSKSNPLMLVVLLMFVGPMISMAVFTPIGSALSHVLGCGAAGYVFQKGGEWLPQGFFFNLDLPLIVLQVISQVPLIFIMVNALARTFCQPDSPAWSKESVLRICFFILFLVTGFCVGAITHQDDIVYPWGGHHNGYHSVLLDQAGLYTFIDVALGMAAGLFLAPTYFQRKKLLVLRAKGQVANDWLSDGASAFFPGLVYVGLSTGFYLFYLLALKVNWLCGSAIIIQAAAYILGFTGLLEYYRLSPYRNNKIWLVTVLGVWWCLLPWFGALLRNVTPGGEPLTLLSPLTGFIQTQKWLRGESSSDVVLLAAPVIAAVLCWIAAYKQQQTFKN